MGRSNAELLLATQLEQAGIPFEREYRFAPPRRWRADFLVRDYWSVRNSQGGHVEIEGTDLLIEIDGGAYIGGRHSRGTGVEADAEKQSAAAILGYRVIRCTPAQVDDGRALAWIKAALGMEVAACDCPGPEATRLSLPIPDGELGHISPCPYAKRRDVA